MQDFGRVGQKADGAWLSPERFGKLCRTLTAGSCDADKRRKWAGLGLSVFRRSSKTREAIKKMSLAGLETGKARESSSRMLDEWHRQYKD